LSARDLGSEAEVLARKAANDARAMASLAPDPDISDEIVGFHAQQAVEKWLKAVLGSRAIEFEYTHDLRRLIGELAKAAVDFPFDTPQVIALTEHAVPLRYDELLDTEHLDREATVSLVEEIGVWAVERLAEGVDPAG
jgi:HEPN domain-containing protein